jgi:CheY-like chemotaxis protein
MTSRKILVVDDNKVLRKKLSAILRPHYALRTACDGAEALKSVDEAIPDLVITDVLMPNMNGWEFVRTLRTRPKVALLPVIFLTTQSSSADLMRGFQLGADDYLEKPVSGTVLLERVAQVLEKRSSMLSTLAPTSPKNDADLQGSLGQLALSGLLSLVGERKDTGVIQLSRRFTPLADGKEQARVLVRDGRVVRAQLRHRRNLVGAEAIYYLLSWTRGRFRFLSGEVTGDDEVDRSTTSLLLEGARQLDEICRLCGHANTEAVRRTFTGRHNRLAG